MELLIGAGVLSGQAGVGYRAMIAHDCEAVSAALRAGGAAVTPADVLQKKLAVLVPPAAAGDMAEVERLLRAGANPNARTPGGWTALMFAAREGLTQIVELLLAEGASARGALPVAADVGWADIVHLLAYSMLHGSGGFYELEPWEAEDFHRAPAATKRHRATLSSRASWSR